MTAIPTHPHDTDPPGIITLRWLRSIGACEYQVEIVSKEWGESHQMTYDTLRRATELGCDLVWLANDLLQKPEPRRVWEEAIVKADRVWEETRAKAHGVWQEATAEANRIWKEAIAEADRVWEETIAKALWCAWQIETEK